MNWRIGKLVSWQIGDLANGVRRRVRRVGIASTRQFTSSPVHQLGFTLIELLIVLTLVVVLASMGMSQYRNSQVFAREAVLKQDLFGLRSAIDQYYADKNQYPSTLDALVTEGYLRRLPEDPFTQTSTSWETIPAEPDPNNPVAEPGVYDVRSGSDRTALDGSKYSDNNIW